MDALNTQIAIDRARAMIQRAQIWLTPTADSYAIGEANDRLAKAMAELDTLRDELHKEHWASLQPTMAKGE